MTKAFSECAYLAAYKRIAAPTQTYELLAKIHSRLFVASKGGMECEADDFFNRIQCKIDSRPRQPRVGRDADVEHR